MTATWKTPSIICSVCGKLGTYEDIQCDGWRLAANMIGHYVCSPMCDAELIERNKRSRSK